MTRSDISKDEVVMDYLFEPAGYDRVIEVLDKYSIGEERVEEVLFICEDVVSGKQELLEVPATVKQKFNVTDDIAKQIAIDLVGYRLLPLEHFMPGVPEAIKLWGGKIEDYPVRRIIREEDTPEYRVKKMAEEMGLELPEELMERFTYLSAGYLKKTRTKEATAKILKRSFDIGGLEFTDTQVEGFFKALDRVQLGASSPESTEALPMVKESEEVMVKEEAPIVPVGADPGLPAEAQRAEEGVRPLETTGKRTPARRSLGEGGGLPVQESKIIAKSKDEPKSGEIKTPLAGILPTGNNIAKFEEKSAEPEKLVVQPARVVEKSGDAVGADPSVRPLESTGKRTGLPVPNEEMIAEKKEETALQGPPAGPENREGAVILRVERKEKKQEFAPEVVFADVDKSIPPVASKSDSVASKVNDVVGADPSVRPLEPMGKRTGLPVPQVPAKKSPAKHDSVPNADPVKNALQPAIEISKKNGIKKKIFDSVADMHMRGVRDPRQTERMLAEQLKLEGEDLQSMMQALEEAKRLKHGEQPKKQDFLTPKSKQSVPPSVQAITTSVQQPSTVRISAARTSLEEEKLRQQKIANSPIAPPKPPKGAVKLTAPSVPPSDGLVRKVADVKFARTLVGPEEELGSMTITEFRRLSTDPVQASKKIEDKLALLEEQSYEARVGGIRAWRRSPLYEIYLDMMREALQSGVSLPEVASNRRNLGEETLSPAEMKAMIDLHRRIGF